VGSSAEVARHDIHPATHTRELSVDVLARTDVHKAPGEIAIEQIATNPHQPLQNFDSAALAELTQSIRQQGILQPLIVTNATAEMGLAKPFVLIAGERRLRAAQQAGLQTVPCIVRQASTQQIMEWAVVENIQRTDLNPIEQARAYRECIERFNLTQKQVAEHLGLPRATIANYLRILELDVQIQDFIAAGQLSFGHAKVLAGVSLAPAVQLEWAQRVISEGLSVRKLVELIASEQSADKNPQVKVVSKPGVSIKPAYLRDIEQQLTERIGTRVTILPGRAKHRGRIVVEYYNLDDFDRIAEALGFEIADGQ
jgi:ParB family chromosome partitioning protein